MSVYDTLVRMGYKESDIMLSSSIQSDKKFWIDEDTEESCPHTGYEVPDGYGAEWCVYEDHNGKLWFGR